MEQYDHYNIDQIKANWYDRTDNVLPYKLVCNGESRRFAHLSVAQDAFEAEEGTAILFDHSDEQTKVLKYKFVE